jgi:hypothetical protein
MSFNENNNEKENDINKIINNKKVNLFKKVDIQMKLNFLPKSEKKLKEKGEEVILPYIYKNRENSGKKMILLQNFCNSIYSKKNNRTLGEINSIREKMADVLNDSKLKAIEEIKHYFFINKFPNEINFKKNKNKLEEIYKKINEKKVKLKPFSLKKLNLISRNKAERIYQDEEKFTYLTTLNIKKENKEKNKMSNSIDTYSKRNRKYNFEDYASNQISVKHQILYKLNKNRNDKLPLIKKKNKIFNDIVEMSKLIPDKNEINKEAKIINYDDYMRMKELKIIK